jgi:hypothetical protein
MFSRFHKEISAQDPENVKWDVDDLSQFHRSRKISQLLRFLVSSELGKVLQERTKKAANKFVSGIFCSLVQKNSLLTLIKYLRLTAWEMT